MYQKYLETSVKVGYATYSLYASSGPNAEGVLTNNQSGRGSGPPPVAPKEVHTRSVI